MNLNSLLPLGQSSFETIIKEGYLYIDKTKYLYNLIKTTRYNFLSRPRRFGKSLLISTLEQIFKGNKELFKGLWIYVSDYDWKEYEVVVFDFNGISADTPDILEISLENKITEIANSYEIETKGIKIKERFIDLLNKIYKKSNKSIVLLIDEYDKPIISHLGLGKNRLEIAIKNREILKNFYVVLKEHSVIEKLRFTLLTGVSKFSKSGVFSELNNLFDLTMSSSYSSMLGITEEEIDLYLKNHVNEYALSKSISYEQAKEEIRRYYNGYRFSESKESVYNPFSLLNLLIHKKLKNYWFESGTPTFLVNLIKEREYEIVQAEEYIVRSSVFSSYEIENLDITTLLFQTGYLTIKEYNEELDLYTLSYPNLEVKNSFIDFLLNDLTNKKINTLYPRLYQTLLNKEFQTFISIMESIFATIPYDQGNKLNESNFHTLFYLILSAGGLPAQSQVLNYIGRLDMLLELKDTIYIFEFKCDKSSKEAIDQILKKEYYKPYLHLGKEIYLVGINFDSKKRNIKEWEIVSLECKK